MAQNNNEDNFNWQSNPFINVERRDIDNKVREEKARAKAEKEAQIEAEKEAQKNKKRIVTGIFRKKSKKNKKEKDSGSNSNQKKIENPFMQLENNAVSSKIDKQEDKNTEDEQTKQALDAFEPQTDKTENQEEESKEPKTKDEKPKEIEPAPVKKFRKRKIYKRSVALSIFYTIITCGIYGIFWQYEIAKETNSITEDNEGFCPALVVFFSIITCGIYGVYWSYKCGKKQSKFLMDRRKIDSACHILYLVLMICNYFVPVLSLIVFAFMQSTLNKILKFAQEDKDDDIYTRDSSIFNRPLWSTVILILIAQVIPQNITAIYESLFPHAPGNPMSISNDVVSDTVQKTVQNSADQIAYADTPFIIANCILTIFCILAVLWWFKLRFKHTNYAGVLVWKNFGCGCLLGLPGLIFIGLNFLDFNVENFKIGIILLGFVPAFVEEISFRGLIIPNWIRIYNRPKGIWISLFVSSAIFGLIHISNIIVGADPGTSFYQAFYAFALGVLFAAIFIRTGNLWITIIIHGLIDAVALMSDAALEQGAVQTQAFTFSWELIPMLVICLFFIGYGIWLCRPKKHEEICKLWSDKWGEAVINK